MSKIFIKGFDSREVYKIIGEYPEDLNLKTNKVALKNKDGDIIITSFYVPKEFRQDRIHYYRDLFAYEINNFMQNLYKKELLVEINNISNLNFQLTYLFKEFTFSRWMKQMINYAALLFFNYRTLLLSKSLEKNPCNSLPSYKSVYFYISDKLYGTNNSNLYELFLFEEETFPFEETYFFYEFALLSFLIDISNIKIKNHLIIVSVYKELIKKSNTTAVINGVKFKSKKTISKPEMPSMDRHYFNEVCDIELINNED